jgi:ATP-binding protein involved in chromosome partitioning
VEWGELDYLIIDMPPGTGDVQITLAQAARLSGAVLVMTPQKLAVDIAKRGLKMFQTVRVPIIGLVENMSEYECPKCGHESHIFKQGGAEAVSKELGIPLLASMPLDPEVVDESDEGRPVVWDRPESRTAKKYLALAQAMAAELSTMMSGGRVSKPEILTMEPNAQAKVFKISWNDGKTSLVSFTELRYLCPCANCVDENTGHRKIRKEDVKPDVTPLKVQTVGNYAVSVSWSDGHDTGIYSYDYLRKLLVKQA